MCAGYIGGAGQGLAGRDSAPRARVCTPAGCLLRPGGTGDAPTPACVRAQRPPTHHAHTCRLLRLGGTGDAAQALAVQQAVVLTASVKTLPVAVTVLGKLGLGSMVGLAVVPCVLAHLAQILIDSVLVGAWKARQRRLAGEGKQE